MRQPTPLPTLDPRGLLTRTELAALGFLARYSGGTLENYRSTLKTFFEWCDNYELQPLDAGRTHLELWIRHLEQINHTSTVVHKINIIASFYEFAMIDEHIDKSPALHIRRPKFSRDESRLITLGRHEMTALRQAGKYGTPSEDGLMALLGGMGLRVSEACNVKIEDVGVIVRGHQTLRIVGKGNKAASPPITIPIMRSLRRAAGDRDTGPLLIRERSGEPLNPQAARRVVARFGRACNIDGSVRPHDLRAGYITGMLDAGVPLRDVQIAARHADPRTTTMYDRARHNLDRHANYVYTAWLEGAA